MTTKHAFATSRDGAGDARPVADLCLFLAQYYLQGPSGPLDDVLTNPAWASGLQQAGLLLEDPGGEPAGLSAHRAEFEDLLRIPGGRFIPPFEQAYHAQKATVEFSAPAACERVYQHAGYDRAPFAAVQADHVGHQLRFLSALLGRLGDAAERNDGDAVLRILTWRDGFLRDRCWWWPRLSDKLLERHPCRQIRLAAALLPALTRACHPGQA
jgi:hypothetical protein